jgi:opacity protein-like surface antigen
MSRLLPAALAAAILIGVPTASQAQERSVFFGPQINWGFDDADFGIGGRVQGDLPQTNFSLIGSFDYFFPGSDLTWWEINTNGVYRFSIPDSPGFEPYAGAGLNITHVSIDLPEVAEGNSSNTDIGLNLLGGILWEVGNVRPFGELRVEIDGGEQVVLTGGVLF